MDSFNFEVLTKNLCVDIAQRIFGRNRLGENLTEVSVDSNLLEVLNDPSWFWEELEPE